MPDETIETKRLRCPVCEREITRPVTDGAVFCAGEGTTREFDPDTGQLISEEREHAYAVMVIVDE